MQQKILRALRSPLFGQSLFLIAEKIFRLFGGMAVMILAARAFGPSGFGSLAYAQSLMVLVTCFAVLGLPEITLREMVRNRPDIVTITLATLVARLAGGCLAVLLAFGVATISEDTGHAIVIVVIVSSALIFQAFDVFEWRMQAEGRAYAIATIRFCIFTLFTIAKLTAIYSGVSLLAFSAILTVEFLGYAIAFGVAYRTDFAQFDWRQCQEWGKRLVVMSLPMLVRSAMIAVYLRSDQLAVRWTQTQELLGLYASAARLTEVWFFLPSAIMMVFAPELARRWQEDRPGFDRLLARLMVGLGSAAFAFAVILAVFSDAIVQLIYGARYEGATVVLPALALSVAFGTVGQISSLWLVNAEATKLAMIQSSLVAMVAIPIYVLTAIHFGIQGVAWAFAAMQLTASVVINGFFRQSRALFWLQFKCIKIALSK